MAFKTFVPGATLTAAEVNTYLAKQSVIVCTSTTRPSSPPEGMTIYETDTDKLLTYTTATTGWQPPWNLPWGFIGRALSASSVVLNNAQGNVTAALTFNVVKNRRYRISGIARAITDVGDPGVLHYSPAITAGNSNVTHTGGSSEALAGMDTGGGEWNVIPFNAYFDAVNSGSVTVYGLGWAASCQATYAIGCSIIVEDIGPSGAPA